MRQFYSTMTVVCKVLFFARANHSHEKDLLAGGQSESRYAHKGEGIPPKCVRTCRRGRVLLNERTYAPATVITCEAS